MDNALTYVKAKLAQPGLNLRVVAEEAGVGASWLRSFSRGEIPDPSYRRVEKLLAYFRRTEAKGERARA